MPRFAESLEPRRLLAASLSGSTLAIAGTSGADAFTVTLVGGNLVVAGDGASQSFAASSVTQITASLGNGDDSITIADGIQVPVSLNGEAGDDTLVGGSGSDTIDGGGGDDTVSYASRSAAVTARLTLHYLRGTNLGDVDVTVDGFGGQSGEADQYASVETLVGGVGNDTLGLYATTDFVGDQPRVTLKTFGGAGDDTMTIRGTGDGSGTVDDYSSVTDFIADGGGGDDQFTYGDILAGDLIGGDGDDHFAQEGDDSETQITGGNGYDTYVITNGPGASYTMPDDLEHLILTTQNLGVVGNDNDDLIEVPGGSVDARGGNDTIIIADIGGGSAVDLHGGSGNDTITGSDNSNDTIDGGSGNDKLIGGDGADSITGGSGDDTLQGNAGNDTLNGEADDDVILGGAGNDCLLGGSGNDQVDPGTGNDTVDGGAGGGDAVTYESRNVVVVGALSAFLVGSGSTATRGGSFLATLTDGGVFEADAGSNVEVLTGGSGNDTLSANVGDADWAAATAADRSPLVLNGVAGDDSLAFRDSVRDGAAGSTPQIFANGGAGDDSLAFTRAGTDAAAIDYAMPDDLENVFVSSTAPAKVTGNDGANRIEVQSTSSIVYGGAGDDSIHGGAGNDTLYGQDGRDKIWGRAGDDRIDGGNSNDVLRGEDGDDRIYGRDGNDQLSGGEGFDRLYGDDGNDELNGDGGRDIVYGGGGTDRGAKQKADRIFKEIESLL